MYNMIFVFLARCSRTAGGFFSHFRPRGKLACHGVHLEACHGSQPSSVAVLGALNVAELALLGKGLRSAFLRRSDHLEHPKLFYNFSYFDKI